MKRAIVITVELFLTLPIWFYLNYKILEIVEATELMWFLYWIYVPATVVVRTITKAVEEGK